jgi:peptide/nickel transport system substrate-binding protein
VEKEVFKDARVRKAVAHAVNRQEIVQFVMKGQADVSHGFLHPLVPGASTKEQMRPFMAEFGLDKSRQLLTDAGWTPGAGGMRQKDGKPLSATLYVSTELHERIVTPVQAQLRQVGFDLQLKRLEAAAFTSATRAGEHDARFLPMIYSSGDFLYFFVSGAIPSPNTTRWRDERTDALFQQSQTSLKEAERIKAFQGIEQRLVGEAVVVPIQHVRWIFGSRPRAHGLKYHPIHGNLQVDGYVGDIESEGGSAPLPMPPPGRCGLRRRTSSWALKEMTCMAESRRIAIRAGFVIAFDGKGHRLLRDGVVVIEGDRSCTSARGSTGGWTRRSMP